MHKNVQLTSDLCVCVRSLQQTYEAKRQEFLVELQKREDEMRQMFVQRVKEKESELKEAEREVYKLCISCMLCVKIVVNILIGYDNIVLTKELLRSWEGGNLELVQESQEPRD